MRYGRKTYAARVARWAFVMAFGVLALVVSAFWAGTGYAQELEHYVNGTEGIKAGSIPPPGLYYRMYNVIYSSDKMTDSRGEKVKLGTDIDIYAQVHRIIWMTPLKVLGADYGADFAAPWSASSFNLDSIGFHDSDTTNDDFLTHPVILSWHWERWDAVAALGVFIPVGERSPDIPAIAHKDYWTFMPTWGGTYYFDKEKTWTASALARYEINTDARHEDLHAGQNFHIEWGVGKSFAKFWEAGVAGYGQWQTTYDSGTMAGAGAHALDRVYAIGPEVSYMVAPLKLQVTVRSEWEFGARNRPEGNVTCIRFTKAF